jgi:CDP-diacylglycerol--glycerol-3-phosphate 3-phosphatidyltransferase
MYLGGQTLLILAFVIFIIASFTDWLDGVLARKAKTTSFGSLMDPISDKILVFSILFYMSNLNVLFIWPILVMLAREFVIVGIRQIGIESGRVISAKKGGKIKTLLQIITIIIAFVYMIIEMNELFLISNAFLVLAMLASVISLWQYYKQNKQLVGA